MNLSYKLNSGWVGHSRVRPCFSHKDVAIELSESLVLLVIIIAWRIEAAVFMKLKKWSN